MLEENRAKAVERKNVLVATRIDSHSRELLSWALVKVAEPGDRVVAIHVCRSCEHASNDKSLLDGYLEDYEGLCSVKKVDLIGKILTGSSVRRVLVREAKCHAAVAVVVGGKQSSLRSWISIARYCAKKLPPTTDILAINNWKIVFRRCNNNQLPGLKGDPKPYLNLMEIPTPKEGQSEFGDSEAETEISSFELLHNTNDETTSVSGDSKDELLSHVHEQKKNSSSPFVEDIMDQRPGWPLLRRATRANPQAAHARNMSVVHWVMSLPSRSPQESPRCSVITENPMEGERSEIMDEHNRINSTVSGELQNGLEILLKTMSSNCKWFSYEVLKTATSHFSSENLVGKGGSNHVYKGILPDGQSVAVKILKSWKDGWKDFVNEVEIISSLQHKHITHFLGVCIENNVLMSVYEFLPKGSLEERLHGKNKGKCVLPWEVRFRVSIGIAEALNFLHSEYSRPVIHRDVKSSNILLSDGFAPQLSDFGLAIWGPTASSFIIQDDVLGTFGYLAPEYFMYGQVSTKIDVYAFGVVLLELLSGRKPIDSETPKGQESLVMWAKPILESGDVRGVLDPNLEGKFDEIQMQRMVLAAALCITRAARLRPNMSEVLKLLRGDKVVEKWVNLKNQNQNDVEELDDKDDEVYPNSSTELHLSIALVDVDDDCTSFSSTERGNNLSSTSFSSTATEQRYSVSLEEYLRERWSRSSSFN